ncbi:hypothetical protein HPB48_021168 [Haemaphysalis longicornis]|uniref:THAP-type domain-containing protein n=1 Tax=Haemaphysalis longicornis TaxID=44386 RepID=A0A9J6FGX5_HAELO|nr:hypothetical protein HPB48_021168 [Haemaphysalis longicornis]
MARKRRLNHCYAPGCKTGYSRTEHVRKYSLFKAPADEAQRRAWERNLRRADKPHEPESVVCELHFEEHLIVRDYVHIIDGKEVRVPRGKPTLAPNAVPTILPNMPAYLSKKTPAPRTHRKRQQPPLDGNTQKKRRITDQTPSTSSEGTPRDELLTSETDNDASPATTSPLIDTNAGEPATLSDLRKLTLPSSSWAPHEFPDFTGVAYVACKLIARTSELVIERAVFFNCSEQGAVECKVFIQDKLTEVSHIATVQEATNLLRLVSSIPLCCGAAENSSVSPHDLTKGLLGQMRSRTGTYFSVNCLGKSTKEDQVLSGARNPRKAPAYIISASWSAGSTAPC